jgi:hypothetical protein
MKFRRVKCIFIIVIKFIFNNSILLKINYTINIFKQVLNNWLIELNALDQMIVFILLKNYILFFYFLFILDNFPDYNFQNNSTNNTNNTDNKN